MNKTMLERECIEEIRRWRDEVRLVDEGQVVFVPTMGALHDGHASLISQAKSLGRYVVVSIFVNRFQFNDPQDYENYPDTRVEDLNVCRDLGVDLVFMPKHAQMYPEEPLTSISVERLSQHLCGSSRPGHFDGVGIVVSKLLNIVEPDIAVFGEKDLQQLQIVRRIVRDLSMNVMIESAPIFRESDGLAFSSRNRLLSNAHRTFAPCIFQILSELATDLGDGRIKANICETVRSRFRDALMSIPDIQIDYIDIVDSDSLSPISEDDLVLTKDYYIVAAVFFGAVRLIDNVRVQFPFIER